MREGRKRAGIRGLVNFTFLLLILVFPGCGSRMPPPGKPDIDPPEIKITYPAPLDTVKGTIYIKYTIKDKSPIQWIGLYVDGIKQILDSTHRDSLFFKSDTLYDGVHKIMLKAKDKWDNTGQSNVVKVITLNGNKKEEKDEGMDREHKGVR